MATFMSRWSNDWPGSGGHLHVSLRMRDGGASAFYDASAPDAMSPVMRAFLAGQQALMPGSRDGRPDGQLLLAARAGLLGADERDLGRRDRHVRPARHPRPPGPQRTEHWSPALTLNPYLTLAAALGSGLWGIGTRLELGARDRRQRLRARCRGGSCAARDALGERARRCAARVPRRASSSASASSSTSRRRASGGARLPRKRHELGARALLRGDLNGLRTSPAERFRRRREHALLGRPVQARVRIRRRPA